MTQLGLDLSPFGAIIARSWSLCCDLCGHQAEWTGARSQSWAQMAIESAEMPCASCGKGRYFVQGVLFVDHAG